MSNVIPNGTPIVNLQKDTLAPTKKKIFLLTRNSSTVKYRKFLITEAG